MHSRSRDNEQNPTTTFRLEQSKKAGGMEEITIVEESPPRRTLSETTKAQSDDRDLGANQPQDTKRANTDAAAVRQTSDHIAIREGDHRPALVPDHLVATAARNRIQPSTLIQ